MNVLLTIISILAGIIVLLLSIALFTRKKYAVEREIKIDRPLATVFDYIRFLKNQDNFSKWATMDPAMHSIVCKSDACYPGIHKQYEVPNQSCAFIYGHGKSHWKRF